MAKKKNTCKGCKYLEEELKYGYWCGKLQKYIGKKEACKVK